MASPIPPDPYNTLGVTKDAELSAIRSAHRKLALKFHPDRIQDEVLREKGKDEFQKIQQAYEILSDPVKRQRYDDKIRLAELRKEAMTRDPPPSTTRAYPMRTASQATPSSTREYREDGNFYEEVRQPRNAAPYDYHDPYDEPAPRPTGRKYSEYEKRAPPPARPAEKTKKSSSVTSGMMAAAFAATLKSRAEKTRNSRADERRTDKEKKRERSDKMHTRRTAYVEDTDSDFDVQEIRPSLKTTPRSKTTSHFEPVAETARKASARPARTRDYDEDSDDKWEKHHEESKAYMAKATNRPSLDRSGSDAMYYWNSSNNRRSSESERRPDSSKGRRTHLDDYLAPQFTKSTSSPSDLRARVEERVPRSSVGVTRDRGRDRDRDRDREREKDRDREWERERERERDRDHRKMVPPSLHRAQTAPMPKAGTRREQGTSKGSNLKHSETQLHDSGYGSSSSPHTPEMRDESPPRAAKTRTKYQVKQEVEGDESMRSHRVNKIYDEYDEPREPRFGRGYHRSPESTIREPAPRESERRKDKPERPKVDTTSRSKSSRGASLMSSMTNPPPVRRSGSGRFEDVPSPRSPRDTPPVSRHNSGREKLFAELSPDEREVPRYSRPYSSDKINTPSRREPIYNSYAREPADYRDNEYSPRFRESPRTTTRRPSVSVGGY
ncbi:uncharacterized protein PV06_03645 [Exophiala oligosperma]|uniref:J domain-containing protein n=1 Tax=Exophiala oligosperma TaxID=215243 RepID=A0A0D2DQS2_9EURO|nr:uncharacterized protein PV06_03645 [Exophiala oligosperma]KIW45243.1 hypothetical protein PV06_03645 [Exophiala oligosperma]